MNIHYYINLFNSVNEECKTTGEEQTPLTDSEYYTDQLINIFGISESEAKTIAKQMAEFTSNQN